MNETQKIALDVGGMKCAGCANAVTRQLQQQEGVSSASVNLVTAVAAVEYVPSTIEPQALADFLTQKGFPAKVRESDAPLMLGQILQRQEEESRQHRWQLVASGILLFLSTIGHFLPHDHHSTNVVTSVCTSMWWHAILATIALALPGRGIIVDGVRSLRRGEPNMNALIGMGAVAAYVTSVVAWAYPQLQWECFFDEPVMLIGVVWLGRNLERQARLQAARGFIQLLELQPPIARLISPPVDSSAAVDLQGMEIPAKQVRVGDWLAVLPGDRFPADGIIRQGKTIVDESALTGEAMPVSKGVDTEVAAGTVNVGTAAVAMLTTRSGKDTTLAQTIAIVERAQATKAPSQDLADRVSAYFTYGILILTIVTFSFWFFWGTSVKQVPQNSLVFSIKLAIDVLVVACPCAWGLATPMAIFIGTGIGARRGILIKSGAALEALSRVETVAFDKTGTLTALKPTLVGIETDLPKENEFLAIAAAVERHSNWLLGKAIVESVPADLILSTRDDFSEPGMGAKAFVEISQENRENWPLALVGRREWLVSHQVEIASSWDDLAQSWAENGQTVVYVAIGGVCRGILGLADSLREDAVATIKRLRAMGIGTLLLTGDRAIVADRVAEKLGIERTFAALTPVDKAMAIESLKNAHPARYVAMVGDGINDAPALVKADVGVSLSAGTDLAIESAEIVLKRDRLLDLIAAIALAKATRKTIRQNLFWAALYNTIAIPLAAGVFYFCGFDILLTPAIAGGMMSLSSLGVVLNSLCLRWR
jgi:Cu2+-exporting ATPase